MGGSTRGTNLDATERKLQHKGRQKPSKHDRMLRGVDKLMKTIQVESSEVQKDARQAITIKNYEFIASYSWKEIEHPTIYVPGLSPPITRKIDLS
jgi:hypothetical protein